MINTDRLIQLQDMALEGNIQNDLPAEEARVYNGAKSIVDSYFSKLTELMSKSEEAQ